jgi:hypothetical protein
MAEEAATPSEEFSNEGSRQIRLPKKSINSEYFFSILLVIRTLDNVLGNMQRIDDPRPPILARQIINRILDDDIKYELLDKFDSKMKEINEMKDSSGQPASSIEKWEEKVRVSQDFVGEVTSYLDEFLALHKGQEIGEV